MSAQVERIADAILYEGYMLYPYRPSSVKNRQRFNFGVVHPVEPSDAAGHDGWFMQTECLLEAAGGASLAIKVRFLQLVSRTILEASPAPTNGPPRLAPVERLEVDGRIFQSWQEAVEREVRLPRFTIGDLSAEPRGVQFAFAAEDQQEPIDDAAGVMVGAILRRRVAIAGELEVSAARTTDGSFKVRARLVNRTTAPESPTAGRGREERLLHSLVSAHTILSVEGGAFVSLLDPPDERRDVVASCRNVNTWPVLAGTPGRGEAVLSSPIIMYDYPEIAPESAGDLFDSTEIDEILSLRILTLTDAEKREMSQADDRSRLLLERTHALAADQMTRLHGTMRPTHRLGADGP